MNLERVKLLRRFVEEDPSDPFPRYALALELTESDPTEANELLARLMVDHPHYIAVYYQAALLQIKAGNLTEAKGIIDKGIQEAMAIKDKKTVAELGSLLDED